MNLNRHFGTPSIVCLTAFWLLAAGPASAQSDIDQVNSGAGAGAYDCTEVQIDYSDDESLTPAEKLALMDKALHRSLSQYDACQSARGRGAGDGASGEGGNGASAAASDISGTDATAREAVTSAPRPTDKKWQKKSSVARASPPPQNEPLDVDNGKLPDDIPPANNDTALEAQIRQAALQEPDPKVRAALWEEYRKYKGLPSVN